MSIRDTSNEKLVEKRDNVRVYADTPSAYAAFQRISWGAVFAGAIVAIATLLLLNLLGLSIGFATINPAQEADPLAGLGIGSAIWLGVSNLIALFAGGWVAGRLAGFPKKSNSMIHGVLAWATFAIFSTWLLGSAAGSLFNAVGSTLSRTAGLAAQGAAAVAQPVGSTIVDQVDDYDISFNEIKEEAAALLEDTGKPALDPDNLAEDVDRIQNSAANTAEDAAEDPNQSGDIVDNYVNKLQDRASNVASAVDKEAVANVIAERRNISQDKAMQIVNGWDKRLDRATDRAQAYATNVANTVEERAPEIAGDVTGALSRASLFAFFALLIGALAAAFGGLAGRELDAAVGFDQALAADDVR